MIVQSEMFQALPKSPSTDLLLTGVHDKLVGTNSSESGVIYGC